MEARTSPSRVEEAGSGRRQRRLPAFLGIHLVALLLLALRPAAAEAQFNWNYEDPVRFSTPTAAHFLAGFIDLPSTNVRVTPSNTNKLWTLRIRSKDPNMGGPGSYGKPISDIQWRVSGSTTWNTLTTSPAFVAQHTGALTVTVEFRILLRWEDDQPSSPTTPFNYGTAIAWHVQQ